MIEISSFEPLVADGWQRAYVDGLHDQKDAAQYAGSLAAVLTVSSSLEISVVGPRNFNDQKYLANTNRHMDLHTDNVYLKQPCKYLVMICLSAAEQGGATILSDVHKIMPELDSSSVAELSTDQWTWKRPQRLGHGPTEPRAVLSRDGTIRWWRYGLMNSDKKTLAIADAFNSKLQDAHHNHKFTMRPGDVVIIDNHRVLHGRESFSGPNREILRARLWV